MHILVPSSSVVGHAYYEVLQEDTYDGLPTICCLEDLELTGDETEDEEGDDDDDDEAQRSASDLQEACHPDIPPLCVRSSSVDDARSATCERKPSEPPLAKTEQRSTPERKICGYGCGRTFSRVSDCQRHEMTHSNNKSWVCPEEFCHKFYGRKDALLRHIGSAHSSANERLRQIVEERRRQTP
ncbi:hypothetical protein FB45DRAFT_1032426 [Roridomyces roridus]|uniref:C2H2-type domain-containing protein n=1 Tax=Roridomyces roridus TaxID=1738132 RepID=A0AAD7BHL9_9AGAR|nr:hypothetical protein FB45DRAFT_1032426 [Roridomyces roridus]